jgi:hypothetical protein
LQSPATIESGETLKVTFAASNTAAIDAITVNVEFTLSAGLTAESAQIPGGTCMVQPQSVLCTLPSLAANADVTGSLEATGATVGPATLQARISSSYIDPAAGNDTITRNIDVTAPSSSPSQSGGGGGGGSTSALWLLALASLLGFRHRLASGRGV